MALPVHMTLGQRMLASRAGRLLLVIAVSTGCGGVRNVSLTPPPHANQRLCEADALARSGQYAAARETYAGILADGTAADGALLGLAWLGLDPTNPDKDDRQAMAYLDRLLTEYPASAWTAEAQALRSLLQRIERLQREGRRQQYEVQRLRRDLQREQQEIVRLRDERERLRQIDVEFERPPAQSPSTSGQSLPRPLR